MTDARVGRVARKSIVRPNPSLAVGRVARKVLYSTAPSIRVASGSADAASDASAAFPTILPPPTRTATGSASGESDASATPTVVAPAVATASGSASAESDTTAVATVVHASGQSAEGSADAEADASADPTVVHSSGTDSANRVSGRDRQGYATASWQPAVVPPPADLPQAVQYDVAQAFSVPAPGGTTAPYQPVYTVATASAKRQRHRVIVGGRDITYFRGVMVPEAGYQLVEPLLYGTATLELPQVRPAFERLGVGPLAWCRKGATVLIQRVNVDTGAVVATDFKGIVIAPDVSGDSLRLEVGGEVTGRASMVNKQLPLYIKQMDIGWLAYHAIADLRIPFSPRLGPTTGIKSDYFGGMGWLDYIQEVCARAQDRQGQWTIMPGADGRYGMTRKDQTTIHATAYLDDSRVVGDLRSDMAEEPNRVFVTAVAPSGRRIRGAVYPGMIQGKAPRYPMNDGSTMTPGTTDADTDTGDGITVMILRLAAMKYLAERDLPGGWDDDVSDAIRALRKDAGRFDNENMNPAVWGDLFDLSATGYSIRGSHIEPLAQDDAVRPYNLTASGAVKRRNPKYDASIPWVDVNVDMGPGVDSTHVRRWAARELHSGDTPNWVGTIKVSNMGALVRGNHAPGSPIGASDVMPVRELRPGMNLRLPLFDGGTTVHVSAVTINADGTADLLVDTRARDAMKVWEIVKRNKATRRNPARRWVDDHRASTMQKDAIGEWDAVGGTVPKIELPGAQWTVFPVVAGQEGTVRRLRLNLDDANAEYAVAIFGRRIGAKRLNHLVGNPLSTSAKARWSQESVRDRLDDRYLLLYAAGDDTQPCGYYPKTKGDTGAVLNGRWQDDAGFSYRTFDQPVLWVAIYPDRDSHLRAGRIMWNQLEAGA